ncbi:alpha/beta fold hydrolase [Flavobacterium hauense]
MTPTIVNKNILFITGAFLSHTVWTEWADFFQTKGYTTQAPPWPLKDGPADLLRQRHPDRDLAALRLEEVINHYAAIASSMDFLPIVIGHSIGGLIAQVLLQRGLAAKAVAIHSVPPVGVFTFKLSFYKAGWAALGFFTSVRKTYMMTFAQWQYGFTNGMPLEWQERAYDLYAIPESKKIVRDTLSAAAKIDFKKPHGPLLFVAGKTDRTIPESLNYDNYRKYKHESSITDFIAFPDRNHFVIGQPGWQEIAQYIELWLESTTSIQLIRA